MRRLYLRLIRELLVKLSGVLQVTVVCIEPTGPCLSSLDLDLQSDTRWVYDRQAWRRPL
jgi:hypothetical protein